VSLAKASQISLKLAKPSSDSVLSEKFNEFLQASSKDSKMVGVKKNS